MQSCPPAWRDRSTNRVRVCGQPADCRNQCRSTFYSTRNQIYTQVHGQVIGYQFGHTDAIHSESNATIDQPYVKVVAAAVTASWFTVDIGNSTTDDIEVHVCSNLYTDNEEDTPIELYVQYTS